MKTLRRALLTLSVAALSFGGVACQPPLSSDDATVDNATSALTIAEESGDVTLDAVGAESADELSAQADSASLLPSMSGDADGVCDFAGQRRRVIDRYDANGNGRLEAAEREALKQDLEARVGSPLAVRFGLLHRAHVVRRLHWIFDTDGDRRLSTEERTAMVDALEARCQRLRAQVLERFDENGNGALDPDEKLVARAAFIARMRQAREAVLARYDADQDGTLNDAERAQLRADRLDAFRTRRAAVIAQFDADQNGTLDDAEQLALKQALTQRIIEGRDAE